MKRIYKLLARLAKRMIAMLTLSCEVVGYKISRSIDGEASMLDNLIIRLHTFGCVFCDRYRRQLIHLHEKLREGEPDEAMDEPGMSTVSRERLKRVLREADPSK